MSEPIVCPQCNGKKQSYVHLNYGGGRGDWKWVNCWLCDGAGTITSETQEAVAYGDRIRVERKARLRCLRDEATDLGCTALELSNVENGRADRALRDKIEGLRSARAERQGGCK